MASVKPDLLERVEDEEEIDRREAIDLVLMSLAAARGWSLEEIWETVERMLGEEFERLH